MSTKTFVNYKAPVNSYETANERFVGIIEPGRVRGFDQLFLPSPGLSFGISHELTGIIKQDIAGTPSVDKTGVLYTKQGVIVHSTGLLTGLAIPPNAGTENRIDVLYYQHKYLETTADNFGVFGVQPGVAGMGKPALPLPDQMIEVGIITLPPGTSTLAPAMYTPTEPRVIGGREVYTKAVVDGILSEQSIAITELTTTVAKKNAELVIEKLLTAISTPNLAVLRGKQYKLGVILANEVTGTPDIYEDMLTIDPFYFYCDGELLYYPGKTTSTPFGNPGGQGELYISKGAAFLGDPADNYGCNYLTSEFAVHNNSNTGGPSDTSKQYIILTQYSFYNNARPSSPLPSINIINQDYFYGDSSSNNLRGTASELCFPRGAMGVSGLEKLLHRSWLPLYLNSAFFKIRTGYPAMYRIDYLTKTLYLKGVIELVAPPLNGATPLLSTTIGVSPIQYFQSIKPCWGWSNGFADKLGYVGQLLMDTNGMLNYETPLGGNVLTTGEGFYLDTIFPMTGD